MTQLLADWKLQGECNNYPADWWDMPGSGEPRNTHVAEAKAICASCPVRDLCLADANETPKNRYAVIRAGIAFDGYGRPRKGEHQGERP
jgi:hypothetical protein